MAMPLIFIGHQTIPVGYSKISGTKDAVGFGRARMVKEIPTWLFSPNSADRSYRQVVSFEITPSLADQAATRQRLTEISVILSRDFAAEEMLNWSSRERSTARENIHRIENKPRKGIYERLFRVDGTSLACSMPDLTASF
jgi:hypothetical protein